MASINICTLTKRLVLLGSILIVHLVEGGSNSSEKASTLAESSIKCIAPFSCQARCSKSTEWDIATGKWVQPHCHCDPDCNKYQDCCADYRQFCGNQTLPSPSDPVFVCRRLSDTVASSWLVESCPLSYKNGEIRNKCHSNERLRANGIMEQIPVVDVQSKIQYKNKYCGLCHGADPLDLFPFKMKIRCNIMPPEHLNNSQVLDYMLQHCLVVNLELEEGMETRFCYLTVKTCPANASSEQKDGCERGPTAVVRSPKTKKNYRNSYCMACHGLKEENCGPQSADNVFNPKSFEVVMNFDDISDNNKVTIIKEKTVIDCKKYVYDRHLEICRLAVESAPTTAISDKYRINMWLEPLDGRHPQNFSHTDFVTVLTTQFVDLLPSQVEVLNIKIEDRSTAILLDLHARYTKKVEEKNNSSKGMLVDALLNFKNKFEMKIARRPWLVFKVTTRRLSCTQTERYHKGSFTLFFNNKSVVVNSTGTLRHYGPKDFYVVQEKVGNSTSSVVVLCRSFFGVHCNHVMLAVKESEYVMFKNKSLLFKPTGQQYALGEYDLVKNTYWICTNYSALTFSNTSITANTTLVKRKLPSVHTEVRRYLTIIGFTISVVCLFLVLLAHGMLRDLREPLPGKNLISLSVSLFLAHFWYLLGSGDTDKPLFCQITACILHYLFLASFGCTFIVAYDTRRTFSVKIAKAHAVGTAQQAKRLTVYLLISWGIPLVLVVTCAVLDWLDVVTIGYRNQEACWIRNKTALLIVFAAPIGLVLVYNVLAFTQTIFAINSARKQTQRVKSSHYARPATVKIYIRLVSLMGFSWFFGISAPLIHDALMYPFVFFTTLQGLYIFLAFVCKARVLRMLKTKLPLHKRKHVHRGQTKGTTTTTGSSTLTPYRKYPPLKDETQI